ncbi:beta-1,4-galactosyltransferase 7 [Onthophagus taurus]|uniref:beta-1,4-galactosyltransferase 7 n=1 Tax=Onthophagus taurus TaxID=166361 RepID=UPI000C20DDF3|nr:beta-1,4-galactosyltransferase 7 [Onthophagus taurus]
MRRKMLLRTQTTGLLVGLVVFMFLVTVFLSFLLLNKDLKCINPTYNPSLKQISESCDINYDQEHTLAVLVPYRDRFEELLEFAPYIHDFLNRQRIKHDIFILNQVDKYRFNRASLINVGFLYTKSTHDYVAMHDVDLLPLNDQLSYAYPLNGPFHVSAPYLHPKYNYTDFVGGILLLTREHFELVNGMSNKYWGWGLEDDEFFVRLKEVKLTVSRPKNITTDRTNSFRHIHAKSRRRDTVKCFNQREVTRRRDRETGVNNVKYTIVSEKSVSIEGAPVNVVSIQLSCDKNVTPWCDCSKK